MHLKIMKSLIQATLILLIVNCFFINSTTAQISINADGTTPDASAMLDITSTDKGILIPRMDSTSRMNIVNPAIGLMVYDTDENSFWYYNGTAWTSINTDEQTLLLSGDTLSISNGDDVILSDLKDLDLDGLNFDYVLNYADILNEILDIEQKNTDSQEVNYDFWQSFTSSYDGYLTSIEANIGGGDINIENTITIYEGQGTGGANLGSLSFEISSSVSWNKVDLSSLNIQIESGQKYTFRIECPGFHTLIMRLNTSNPYSGGRANVASNTDYKFRTYCSLEKDTSKSIITVNPNGDSYNFSINNVDTIHFTDGYINLSEQVTVSQSQGGLDNFTLTLENLNNKDNAYNNGINIIAGQTSGEYNSSKQGDFIRFTTPDSIKIGSIYQDAAGSIALATTSDIRLKTNIQTSQYGLSDILNIQVRDYHYKSDAAQTPQTGFLAQQLNEVFPVAVRVGGEDAKTNPWTVDYSKLTPLLVKGMQEQQVVIDAQNEKINALEAQNKKLETQVSKIQQLEQQNKKLEAQVAKIEQLEAAILQLQTNLSKTP